MNRLVVAVGLMLGLFAVTAVAQFKDWETPVNLGPVVNTQYVDNCNSISKNGLSLFFVSNRYAQNTSAPWHLYVAKRPSVDAAWGEPVELVGFNDGIGLSCPALSLDEHRLFFSSTRPGEGCGASDLWVSRRHDRKDDFHWGPPVNLGCMPNGPNSSGSDGTPTMFEDENGVEVLYFASVRTGGLGSWDLYATRMKNDDTFGPSTPVAELNTPFQDYLGAIRRDGLEIIVASDRTGTLGSTDFWGATRESTADPWPPLQNIKSLNTTYSDGGKSSISFDGREFYFVSNRPGGYGNNDIYVAKREKLHGRK